ncbi:MAG: hypothetical protein ACR2GK_12350, partial [Gemmatimonadaceae bacterium]
NASSEPLYIIDGVVMSNVAIPSNQNAVTRSTGGSNPNLTQDGRVNRIADINPAQRSLAVSFHRGGVSGAGCEQAGGLPVT